MNQPPDVSDEGSATVSFTAMQHGTFADYQLLERYESQYAAALPHRVYGALERLTDSLAGYQVSRLQHSLQTASRARRDGADVEWIVAALVHDLGDELAPYNHGEVAAAILAPYVRQEIVWVVRHHGLFQNYYYAHHLGGDQHARDQFLDSEHYQACLDFCAHWDQPSFDPSGPTDSLSSFADELEAVFTRAAWAQTLPETSS